MFQHRTRYLFAIFLSLIVTKCASSFNVPSSCHIFNGGKFPTVLPSMTNEGSDVCPMYDTWVVGSGTLGTHLISQLQSQCAGGKIVAETRSESRKKELEGMGALHVTRDQRIDKDYGTARNVIICLPPSCSSSYADEVSEATRLWAGRKGGGNLVYTSSIGVYGDAPGCTVTEATPVNDSPESVSKSRLAEQVVLAQGGSIVRLAGLYSATRGPHSFWLEKTRNGAQTLLSGSSASLVNMVHYEDAASATIAAMRATELPGNVFLACDNEPVSRAEICQSALASGLYQGCGMPEFTSAETSTSKVCNSSLTRKLLHWEPRYSSFRVFMRRLGGESVRDAPHRYDEK